MKGDLIVLNEMAVNNEDILCLALGYNLKRTKIGKNGWGEIVIAIPNHVIANLDNYIGALYLANYDRFFELKNE